MLRMPEPGDFVTEAPPSGEIISLTTGHERARYGEDQRPNLFAMAGSLGVVGLLLAAFLTMNIVSTPKAKQNLTLVELRAPEPPAPPPPPQPQPRPTPVKQVVNAPSPIVAPEPLIRVIPSPVQITTSPAPPPPVVSVPGPPSSAPAAPQPAIESAGDLSSTMISATPPRYPHESRRKREQGTVVLMVLLAVDGTVADVSIAQSSGFARLDDAALKAVRRWRWSPTRRNGDPVMVRGLVEIPFILQG